MSPASQTGALPEAVEAIVRKAGEAYDAGESCDFAMREVAAGILALSAPQAGSDVVAALRELLDLSEASSVRLRLWSRDSGITSQGLADVAISEGDDFMGESGDLVEALARCADQVAKANEESHKPDHKTAALALRDLAARLRAPVAPAPPAGPPDGLVARLRRAADALDGLDDGTDIDGRPGGLVADDLRALLATRAPVDHDRLLTDIVCAISDDLGSPSPTIVRFMPYSHDNMAVRTIVGPVLDRHLATRAPGAGADRTALSQAIVSAIWGLPLPYVRGEVADEVDRVLASHLGPAATPATSEGLQSDLTAQWLETDALRAEVEQLRAQVQTEREAGRAEAVDNVAVPRHLLGTSVLAAQACVGHLPASQQRSWQALSDALARLLGTDSGAEYALAHALAFDCRREP